MTKETCNWSSPLYYSSINIEKKYKIIQHRFPGDLVPWEPVLCAPWEDPRRNDPWLGTSGFTRSPRIEYHLQQDVYIYFIALNVNYVWYASLVFYCTKKEKKHHAHTTVTDPFQRMLVEEGGVYTQKSGGEALLSRYQTL